MATSTKASSFNFYQNGKYGTIPHNPQKDAEVTQDMHLKMSKKIAQLTKVIYALNTKNDENEIVIQSIKDHHEQETQQLLAETKGKVEYFQSKMKNETENLKQVEILQKALQQHEANKKRALEEFESYKKHGEEREMQLKTDNAQKMLSLSQELLTMKKDFESKLDKLDHIKSQFERDKHNEIADLQRQHQNEIQNILQGKQSQEHDLVDAKKALEEKYNSEILNLNEQCEKLKAENKTTCEEYEAKLQKLQAFHAKELAAMQESQSKFQNDTLHQLQDQYDKLQKDKAFNEKQYKKQVEDLLVKLGNCEDEMNKYKNKYESLNADLVNATSSSSTLGKQLEDAKHEASEALQRFREIETELTTSKERCSHQATDLLKKSTLIGELEATKMQNESTIQDMTSELSRLQDRLSWLENERNSVETKSYSETKEHLNRVKVLETALDDLSIEKQKMQQKYEKDIKYLQEKQLKDEEQLKHIYEERILDSEHQHKEQLDNQSQELEHQFNKLTKELQDKFDSEKYMLTKELEDLNREYKSFKQEMEEKLIQSHNEIARLEKIVRDSEQGLGSATSHVSNLQAQIESLKRELDTTRDDLRSSKNKSSSLHSELEKLKQTHESKISQAELELQTRLERQAKELEEKWTNNLRKENMKLRHELTQQKEADKRAALEQLSKLKDEEMNAAKLGWQAKTKELLQQVSDLKTALDSKDLTTSEQLDEIKKAAEKENMKLMAEMLKSAEEYAKKIETLENMYKNQLEQLENRKNQETKDIELRIKTIHVEDMQVQLKAHNSTMEMVKQQSQREREKEVEAQQKRHLSYVESLKSELYSKHAQELEQQNQAHQMHMQAARMELDRAVEIGRHKEAEFEMRCSDLNEEVQHKQGNIASLSEELHNLQQGINEVTMELESKSKQMTRLKNEANHTLKAREEQLRLKYHEKSSNKEAEHLKETQDMLAQFNNAQEMLKDKISELQIMLEEAEDRYRHRPSRPEDLHNIKKLQESIREKEELMHRFVEEKKYYQMELVNRETNFNKVFNATPNVGVLNPFGKKGGPGKMHSTPALAGGARLNPLPGSPFHDSKINPNKPLPSNLKKFVK